MKGGGKERKKEGGARKGSKSKKKNQLWVYVIDRVQVTKANT